MSSLRERLNRLKGAGGKGAEGTAELSADERSAARSSLDGEEPASAGESAERSIEEAEGRGQGDRGIEDSRIRDSGRRGGGNADSADAAAGNSALPPDAADWARLSAEWVETEAGPFIRRTTVYPLSHGHGDHRLTALEARLSGLNAFGEPVAEGPESLLFFDTETTGLGQGAGNVPFMIGLGFYREAEFVIEQLFIRNPAEELAMLVYLNGKLTEHTHLVSYNGKSFDWPLVLNRFVMNRMRPGRIPAVHLDFLHPSRSLWKHTLPSCKLGKVEEERLGFHRVEDVPGSLAPTLYFRYLAEQDPEIMRGVFVHNEWDLLSLAGLAIHFGGLLQGGLPHADTVAEEEYRLGLWLAKMGKLALAEEAFERLLARPPEESGDYWHPLGLYYKKQGKLDKAAELWRKAVGEQGDKAWTPVEAFVELSMYHEHALKEYCTALAYVTDAQAAAQRRLSLSRASDKQRAELAALEKRAERLRRKVAAKQSTDPRQRPAAKAGRPAARPARSGGKAAPPCYAGSLFD
ncbi:ribonuclease H-like domain-containing protein [Gorillibacterium sp. sgz500922]|uniref:ribonuclease H-like domain-containing protein n=1 Tax=Gorillibacterium sp. sgz500922 TaxID=3446694 RepID=UPI003F672554